jgi:hypothetical protein
MFDKLEITKQTVENGFRIFSEKNKKGTPVTKKEAALL